MLTPDDNQELRALARDHYWPFAQSFASLAEPDGLQIMVEGEGCWVRDTAGGRWFDAMSGNCLVNLGYGRPELAAAAQQQLARLPFAPQFTAAEPAIRLCAELAAAAPDPRSRVMLVSGGSEAVETALKMARKFHKNRGQERKLKVISRQGSYHGATLTTAALGGRPAVAADFGPFPPECRAVTQPYHLRCGHCSAAPACTLRCADEVEEAILAEGPETVSAVIAEPISMCHLEVPHRDYFPRLREICDRHGVLLILDEVITGLGRTGRMFASEHWEVRPDITAVCKGLGSGHAPIGAVIASRAVADGLDGSDERLFRHLFTYGGNPVSAAVALEVLAILRRESLVARVAELGALLETRLEKLRAHPLVGDVRGKGLMWGIEVVQDRRTRALFPAEAGLPARLTRLLRERRLLVRQGGNLIYLLPPFVVTADELSAAVEHIESALTALQQELTT